LRRSWSSRSARGDESNLANRDATHLRSPLRRLLTRSDPPRSKFTWLSTVVRSASLLKPTGQRVPPG
jgi:hypothetical protein